MYILLDLFVLKHWVFCWSLDIENLNVLFMTYVEFPLQE